MRQPTFSALWVLFACLLAVGVMPSTAWAQDDFKRYFNAAVQLYNSGESERAQEQLQRAKQRAKELDQDVAIALYEGLILMDLGKREQALTAFETGLLLNPEAKLPTKVSPKISGDFEAVRQRVQKKLAQGTEPKPPANAEKTPTKSPAPPAAKPPEKTPKSEAPTTTATGPAAQPPAKPNLKPPPAPEPKPYEPQHPVAEQSRSRTPVVPLVLGGVGVAAAGVGTVFGMQSRSNTSKVKEAYEGGRLPSQSELSTVNARLNDARGQARMANVLWGTAALAAGGAVVTWMLGSGDSAAESKEAP